MKTDVKSSSVDCHCRRCCRRRRVSVKPWSCGSVTQGDASAVSSADLVLEPCSVLRFGRGLPRYSAAVRSSPGTARRCVRSSVYSRGRRSAHTHPPQLY